ncbi:MAG: acetylglutamate kinase [Euryarchaeota archaeon]|nr:acetylglutamate kinase [Euryarchaeota archaeon]
MSQQHGGSVVSQHASSLPRRGAAPSNGRRVTLVKLGGHAMEDASSRTRLLQDLVRLIDLGLSPVIVHGAGPQIDAALKRQGIEPRFVNGLRVTDDATLAVVEATLAAVGKSLVGELERSFARSVSISGRDGHTFNAVKKGMDTPRALSGGEADLGLVGEIKSVDVRLVECLLAAGFIPVISPISSDGAGGRLNVNADEAAAALAVALKAESLILMTDVAGVKDAAGHVLTSLSADEADALLKSGVANGGMVPKLTSAIAVVEAGVGRVVITGGTRPDPLTGALSGKNAGTTVIGRWGT